MVATRTDNVDRPRDLDAGVVDWLLQSGANGKYLYFADTGITSNGHMMLDCNSHDIVKIIVAGIGA